uniref:Hypothetical chloroplast RF66 n=1 Tax=Staurastrum punctulatum TaxID=102822 RepID=Q32RW3_STAPU|nr:hypothetical chloroplast RF66 [Staurastrum punctulatum]AAX45767.1 hypothetical chloroplast RF66 [Staurastrum punctulatum]
MIHMELGPSTIVGVGLALIGFLLYLVKTKKPDVSRDYDLFFSSVGLLCGGILIFQGWRLDPILLLCQILSSATAIFFIGESLWLRGIKSKNRKIFPPKYHMGKKNVFLPLELAPSEIQKIDEAFSSQDFFDKRVFFSDDRHEDLKLIKEKTFSPSETQRAKEITKISQQYFLQSKKRAYEEKKLVIYYQLKNKSFEFDYTDPIDYCHTIFSTKE